MGKKIDLLAVWYRLKEKTADMLKKVPEWKRFLLPLVTAAAVISFWIFGGDSVGSPDGIIVSGEEPSSATEISQAVSDHNMQGYDTIYVDIGGAVCNPGVYQVPSGTRLFQVIEKAGGLKESAATDSINQAEAVSDGQKIIIGSLDKSSPYYIGVTGYVGSSSFDNEASASGENPSGAVRMTQQGMLININRATSEELQMIPGIGPSTAQKIIDYREEHGIFQSPEDIKKISGIGEKTYDNLKDYIET